VALPQTHDTMDSAQEPIRVEGPEQAAIRPELPDGGLPPVFGVQSFQVFRACHDRPDLADGRGWTYNHHMDLACWKGRLYVGWESGERDEDIWPAHELYSTSLDGVHWSTPQELFPQGVATPLRMYFFHAPNGRMLALAGARIDQAQTTEKRKGPLVVREIHADHTLGTIYTLRTLNALAVAEGHPPLYTQSADPGFIRACEQLLANRPFLEQQDYGNLLGSRAMTWHDPNRWPHGKYPDDDVTYFGKSLSFYHRKDGKLVGVAKKGWATVSADEGETWSEPVVPPSLVTWTAKVWGQRTADGRYALVYNPRRKAYYPLVVVTGEDGIRYNSMRVVYGEAPIMRYAGRAKEYGPRYVRGISEWSSDGSRHDQALWVVYSVNEEDIWVSRIPTPIHLPTESVVEDDWHNAPLGPLVSRWNTYSPKWTSVTVAAMPESRAKCLQLEDHDPYDYAYATRLFAPRATFHATFVVQAGQADHGTLEIEVGGASGDAHPVRLVLAPDGNVQAMDGDRKRTLCAYQAGQWLAFDLHIDAPQRQFSVTLNGKPVLQNAAFCQNVAQLERLTFRTGEYRGGFSEAHAAPGSDLPSASALYRVQTVRIVP
jgi:hypothetical protein